MKIILQVVWWALIEQITSRAKEMACKKKMTCCVRGYHVYKDIWAAAIVYSKDLTNAEKIL